MGKVITNNNGTIEISEEVIATIAGAAAIECYGLVGMVSHKIADGWAGLLGRENLAKGVVVAVEENEVIIDLYIMVGYGVRISEVAANVMERVHYALKTQIGLNVAQVNVNVKGVRVFD